MATKKQSAKKSAQTKPRPAAGKHSEPAVKVALLGFGTVGSSVATVLAAAKFPGIQLTHIFNRNVARKVSSPAAKSVPASAGWTDDINVILNSDVDIAIELMGGLNPVEGWLRKAMASGQSVVTANKQLIAYRGAALTKLAAQHHVPLSHGYAYSAAAPACPATLRLLC